MRMQRPDGPSICETATECWVSAHQVVPTPDNPGPQPFGSSSDWKGLSVMKHPGILVLGKYYFFAEKYLPCELSPPLGWVATVERLIAALSPSLLPALQEILNGQGRNICNVQYLC